MSRIFFKSLFRGICAAGTINQISRTSHENRYRFGKKSVPGCHGRQASSPPIGRTRPVASLSSPFKQTRARGPSAVTGGTPAFLHSRKKLDLVRHRLAIWLLSVLNTREYFRGNQLRKIKYGSTHPSLPSMSYRSALAGFIVLNHVPGHQHE